MEIYQTENQQLEALKQFLRRYTKLFLTVAAVAIVIMSGASYWKHHKQVQTTQASDLYQGMLVADAKKDQPSLDAKGTLLLGGFSSTPYPQLAALLLAKNAVAAGKFDKAEEHLRWILKQKKSAAISPEIATARLARVLLQSNKIDAGLKLLADSKPSKSYITIMEEARGDLYVAKGELQQAKAAYLKAMENVPAGIQAQLIQIKLLDLGVVDDEIKRSSGEQHV